MAREILTSLRKEKKRKLLGEGDNDFVTVLKCSVGRKKLLVLPGVCSGALILPGIRSDQRYLDTVRLWSQV